MADTVGGGFPSSGIQKGGIHFDVDDNTLWEFLGGPATSISSWKLLSGIFTDNPDTSGWGTAQRGATWWNVSEGKLKIWNGSSIQDITPDSSMYDYNNSVKIQDDFLTGIAATGSVGTLGWNLAGTITSQIGELNYPGIFRISSSAVAGTLGRINFHTTSSFHVTNLREVLWVQRANEFDADTSLWSGCVNNISATPPQNGVLFSKIQAETTWFAECIVSGSATRVDTGVVVSAQWVTFKIVYSITSVQFYINNNLVATITTNIPTAQLLSPIIATYNNGAAAAKTTDIDYFELMLSLSR